MQSFHEELKQEMDLYVHDVYAVSRAFPKEEMYGVTSQLRRAALSVVLNYVEGYARQRVAVMKNFFEISYGSLQESKYLIGFSFMEKYLDSEARDRLLKRSERIAAMLWGTLKKMP